jgi:N-acetylmuramoyl-L-alanine amidase
MRGLRGTAAFTVAVLVLLASLSQAQAPAATSFTLISREGRRAIPTTSLNGQEVIALDDVASLFQATLREDALTGGMTLTYRGRTIVAAPNQTTVSVNGRVVALPSPVARSDRRWFVPVEFLQSALGAIHDQRIQVRRPSRLVLVGDVRVPRVTARIDTPGPPTRAILEVAPGSPMAATVEGTRVTIRIEADALDLQLPPGGGGLINQMRAGDQPNTVSVVLAPGAGTVRSTPQVTDTAARMTLEVQAAGPPAAPDPAAGASPAPAPAAPPALPPPGPEVLGALLSPRGVLQTIVIDAGHGGDDRGVRGTRGGEEKRIALDIAQRLKGLVESRVGARVIMTRDGDATVGLEARTATANNNKADLFLSLHVNGALSPKVAGAEVSYLKLDREGESARAQAVKGAIALPVLGGGSRTLDLIPWELAQARHVEDSARLARIVAEELGSRVTAGPSPVRQAPLRLLEGLNMPAAVVEVGYLTNPAEEKALASNDFKNTVAQALVEAIVRFRRLLEERRPR